MNDAKAPQRRSRLSGPTRVLVVVYGILALAATGRSVFQIIDRFADAPIAFTLSAVAAVVYIVATLALALRWTGAAWATIGFELLGVLVIGTLSVAAPGTLGLDEIDPFGREATVWSVWGMGYLFIPLVLPVIGLWYLWRARAGATTEGMPEPSPR